MKKRVLIVASGGLDKSGVPSVIMTIVRQLRQEYAFDILLSARNVGYFEQEFLDCGGRIFRYKKKRFPIGALNTLADFFRPVSLYFITRRMLAREGPYHAVHCHNEFDMAGSLAAAAVQGVPLRIGHVHKTWAGRGGPLTRAYRFLCRKAINAYATARLGCSSQANAAFYGAEASAQAVNNPYDETRFFPDAGETAENGDIRMVQVGYFCDNKNQRFTVEVLAELLKMGRDARLCLAGDARGAYGKALEEEIRAWGLQDRVTLLPPDTDIPALMKKCNLLFQSFVHIVSLSGLPSECLTLFLFEIQDHDGGQNQKNSQTGNWRCRNLFKDFGNSYYNSSTDYNIWFHERSINGDGTWIVKMDPDNGHDSPQASMSFYRDNGQHRIYILNAWSG